MFSCQGKGSDIVKCMLRVSACVVVIAMWTSVSAAQGLSWSSVGGPAGEPVTSVAVDSSGRVFARGLNYVSSSIDHGVSWHHAGSPSATDNLTAHVSGALFAGTFGGTEKSTDGGVTWIPCGEPFGNVTAIAFGPGNRIFAATRDYGCFVSTNAGQYWTNLSNGQTTAKLRAIAIAGDGTIYVGAEDDQGLYRSSDLGVTWVHPQVGAPGRFIFDLAVGTDGSVLAATRYNGLFRSTDKGESWVNVLGTPCRTICVAANGVVYAATHIEDRPNEGQICRSTDNGATWTTTSWSYSRVYELALDKQGNVFAAFTQGLAVSTDAGKTWKRSAAGGRWHALKAAAADSAGTIYGAADNYFFADAGIFTSNDDGLSWERIHIVGVSEYYVTGICIDAAGDLFYGRLGSGGGLLQYEPSTQALTGELGGDVTLLRTLPDGSVLASVFLGTFKHAPGSSAPWQRVGNGTAYAGAAKANGTIFLGYNPDADKLLRCAFNGTSWISTPCFTGLPAQSIIGLHVTKNDDVLVSPYSSGVFRSTDNGDHWIATTQTTGTFRRFVMTSDGVIYAGSREGQVICSTDGGVVWTDQSTGLPGGTIESLTLTPSGRLLVGTTEQGVYRTTTVVTGMSTGSTVPSETQLLQNYPNPFNPSTTIRYRIPERTHVRLSVYSVLGQEVRVLRDGMEESGDHMVIFDAQGLASGVYIYRLQAGTSRSSKQLVVIR